MLHSLPRNVRFLAIAGVFAVLTGCGGGGGGGGNIGGGGGGGNPPVGTVTVSGRITFDRVPFKATLGDGLDPTTPVQSPAREVVVEAVSGSSGNGSILATTTTDANGNYSFTVPAGTTMRIRAKAQMVKTGAAPTWSFNVRNNTNSDALYALDGPAFDSGSANSTRDLRAGSGWGTTSYTGARAAAPFAILDTVYDAKTMILAASPNAVFPTLDLFWSSSNRPTANAFCPDTGDIGTSFYTEGDDNDGCTPSHELLPGIYILGDFSQRDTDEFDRHVIAHEFGHYVEDKFSRSDSLGGDHGFGDKLDLRLAFGEGWGNAFAGMANNDPEYRDSQDGVDSDFGFNLEAENGSAALDGWFSEFSVMEILWDLFDNVPDGADNIALGFAPIFTVMTSDQVDTDAVTSIFSFVDALRSRNSGVSSDIDALLTDERIFSRNEFAVGETNQGGSTAALPVYTTITSGGPVPICTSSSIGGDGKLGFTRFLRFDVATQTAVTITATGAVNGAGTSAAQDPDIFVYRRGVEVVSGTLVGTSETISQQPLTPGTYIIEVFDAALTTISATPRCMTVSIQSI
jgi:hypothetical protein